MASTDKKNVISSLIESGKAKGKLSTKDITDALEELDYDVEQVDKLYSMLEGQNIEIVEEGASLDGDLEKLDLDGDDAEDSLDLSFVDGVNIDDPVKVYLKEIGRCRCSPRMRKWSWLSVWLRAMPMPRSAWPKPTFVWWSASPSAMWAVACSSWT